MTTFEGYELDDVLGWNLDEEEKLVLRACIWMVDNQSTVRRTAANFGYSHSTFWRRIHKKCKELSPDLYKRVCYQMKVNKKRSLF